MFGRPRLDGHLVARLALGLGLSLAASTTLVAGGRDSNQPIYNLVAVGRGPGKILLATLASPADKLEWRFREIPVSPSESTLRDVELSAGGTKALVVFSDGTPRVFDLTRRITEIGVHTTAPPQHRLPQQRFPFSSNGEVWPARRSGRLRQRRLHRGKGRCRPRGWPRALCPQ